VTEARLTARAIERKRFASMKRKDRWENLMKKFMLIIVIEKRKK